MQKNRRKEFRTYVVPFLIIVLIGLVSVFYAIFLPRQNVVAQNLLGVYTSIFNGYGEEAGNLQLAVLNISTAMILVAFSAWCIEKLLNLKEQINVVFLIMLISQLWFAGITGFTTPKFVGGVSLFDTDCLAIIVISILAYLIIAILNIVRRVKSAEGEFSLLFFLLSGVVPAMLLVFLSVAADNYTYINYAPRLAILSLVYYFLYKSRRMESLKGILKMFWLFIAMVILAMELFFMYIYAAVHLLALILFVCLMFVVYGLYGAYVIWARRLLVRR